MPHAGPAAPGTPNGTDARRPPMRLLVPPRALAPSPLGDTDAQERTLHRRPGTGKVGRLGEALLERSLGLTPRSLGCLEVDLRGQVGGLGHHDDLVRANLDEA